MTTKTCTHCGRETHSQPQDWNHDKGYGHCYDCLNNPGHYIKSAVRLSPEYLLTFYEELSHYKGTLTTDDSHAKVVELHKNGHLYAHYTGYSPKASIIATLTKKYC